MDGAAALGPAVAIALPSAAAVSPTALAAAVADRTTAATADVVMGEAAAAEAPSRSALGAAAGFNQ